MSASLTLFWFYYSGTTKCKDPTRIVFHHTAFDALRNRKSDCQKCSQIKCKGGNCSAVQIREIIICLRRAKQTIDICLNSMSKKLLMKEIIASRRRGIEIRVLVRDLTLLKSRRVKRLRRIGIKVKGQMFSENNHKHDKYAIVDSECVINGSADLSEEATLDDWKDLVVTNALTFVRIFTRAFERDWETVSL